MDDPDSHVERRIRRSMSVPEGESVVLFQENVDGDDVDWRRNSQAAVMACLPSHQAQKSDAGLTLTRSMSLKRRRSSKLVANGSSAHDIELQPSMLDSDTRANEIEDEEERWLRSQSVRSMTTNMTIKRRYRDEIQKGPARRLGGIAAWKYRQAVVWKKLWDQGRSVGYQLSLWASSFKQIEGRFGSAILSYYRFVKWLLFLNLYICLILFCVTSIPQIVLGPDSFETYTTINTSEQQTPSSLVLEAVECTKNYSEHIQGITAGRTTGDSILDFLQGTGWMERTVLFYGVYYNRTYPGTGDEVHVYNMGLAYMISTATAFIISFILIVRNSAKGVKESLVDQESSVTQYCNKVFCGWDCCMNNGKAAEHRHKQLTNELQSDLELQRLQWRRSSRTTKEWVRLSVIRILVNFFVIAILSGSFYLIYYASAKSLELINGELSQIARLLVEYLPSATITLLNMIVPLIFVKIVIVEDYSPAFEIRFTLIRMVALRLASLGVLMLSLYNLLIVDSEKEANQGCGNSRWQDQKNSQRDIKCWETYVGQQLYKLVLLDFFVIVAITFIVEFPRKLMVSKFHKNLKIFQFLGYQAFDLPTCVLDIVYSQTLCWLGLFFSPMVPVMCLFKCFFFFYIKKLTLLRNCVPAPRAYRTSRSNSFFMTVLLFAFISCALPIGYMIGNIPPSQSCGPFRVYSGPTYVMFHSITNIIHQWPSAARDLFIFIGTAGFLVPGIIILCLLMYYYWAVAQGQKRMAKILRDQLKLEGQDKQFLLARVNDIWRRREIGSS